jgi:threonine synthase
MTLVQAANCDPIVRASLAGAVTVAPIEKGPTIASALAGADPGLLGARALEAVRESGGTAIGVEDSEIIEAMTLLAKEGLFIEPSGAVAIAGLRRLVTGGRADADESVVCVVTGSGFKDFDAIASRVTIPDDVVDGYEQLLSAAVAIG